MSRKSELLSFSRMRAYVRRRDSRRRQFGNEPALRSELFSADQMERHGQALAAAHRSTDKRAPDLLLARLDDNEAVLSDACKLLTAAARENRRITPAAEWLLDNFYLIEEQIHTARRHFPKGYSRELPRLTRGPSSGLPRVYDIALEAISHGDGRVDTDSLSRFVASYQSVTPLRLGELWAIPIMLRLALIENLRRVGGRVIAEKVDRALAEYWTDQLMDVAERDPKNVVLAVADMARSEPPMSTAFVAELTRRLLGQSSALALPLTWTEHWLAEAGYTIEQLVQMEAQQQAADQVSIGNSIGSLRALAAIDWRDFVESLSAVEQVLLEDPAGVYSAMDFATRDQYRHAVEALARRSTLEEAQVARAAVDLAAAAPARDTPIVEGEPARDSHVGFYLLDRGRRQLEASIDARRDPINALRLLDAPARMAIYFGCALALTVAASLALIAVASRAGIHGWALLALAVPILLATGQLAIGVVNWLATLLVSPRGLPRMDFSRGIPIQARTLVVVPTMLTNVEGVDDLAEALEVRYLANRERHLHFGLLTDFLDAPEETQEKDAVLVERAQRRIEELNAKYATEAEDLFFLFHRPRRWNPRERTWMGFERKRGKLSELNALLRGEGRDRFSCICGDIGVLANVRYVITLDTDTQLPRETAAEFIGTMEHPLNRPVRDQARRRIVKGFGILQPRIGISLSSTARSDYARLFGSDAGVDPYTRAVSDVYQDVFHEGSFIGKGIYDVDAFEFALGDRFPENAILSHDLVEGCYARSGLLSDVQLYEAYPSSYRTDVSRRHRWIRGDWQLLPWLLPWVPVGAGKRARNPLSALSWWKIFDNLRRSLVAASLVFLFVFGWLVLPSPTAWTLALLAIPILPPLLSSLQEFAQKPRDLQWSRHVELALESTGRHFVRVLLGLAWLPHEAYYSLDAIVRTLGRVFLSRRRLLQWKPSSEVERSARDDFPALLGLMWIGPVLAISSAVLIALWQPAALLPALPILLLWLASPNLAWQFSRSRKVAEVRLEPGQTRYLRRLARRTWAFFEVYVGAEDNWLPPDNMQEQPTTIVAHRTSPTNIGMALLANLAAHDFGYLGIGALVERTSNTLRSMLALERYRGHFLNWYDTQSLLPLEPRYVSSVDSGNLAGHLLTLRPGLLALPDERLVPDQFTQGLLDTLELLEGALGGADNLQPLSKLRAGIEEALVQPVDELSGTAGRLRDFAALARELLADSRITPNAEDGFWAQSLARQIQAVLDELIHHAPWLADNPGADAGSVAATSLAEMKVPSLRVLAQLEPAQWPEPLRTWMALAGERARARIAGIEGAAWQAGEFARMQYDFLYDSTRHLLAIGYNVQDRRLDDSYYDLLASEARLASFVGIAQGALPQEGWFTLSRMLTITGGQPVLLSWSGSMFEYLMPLLVMPTFEGTLLDQTGKAAVARQIEYGNQRNVPWGVSESGYNTVDIHLNYQYRAFGVPGLGLKRGLSEDMVIAPYATALALMVEPAAACENLQRLSEAGLEGRYGMYEAIDYTPTRLPRGHTSSIVRSFMAHHQGMSLLAMAYALLDRPMQKRFESDPQFQATVLLLQERVPKAAAEYLHTGEFPDLSTPSNVAETKLRVFTDPDTGRPAVQMLSNGRYHVMIDSAGAGYSRFRDMAVTRWHEDFAVNDSGTFCYLRDVATGEFWSTSHQPTVKRQAGYEAIFSDARVEFRSREKEFDTHTEIVVSPEDDIELRRTTILNRSRVRRTIEVTSYAEVVLAPAIADALHPAFSKLFVQTELVKPLQAIICTRRPRAADEAVPWMCHLMAIHDADAHGVSYETDRSRFLGRGNSVARPAAMSTESSLLSDSEGSVLDPIVAIRCRVTLEPEQSTTIDIVTGIGESRAGCLALIEKYRDRRLADRVFDLAWTHSQVLLRQLNASQGDAQLYERLAGSILFAHPALRADASILVKNRRGQSGLWGQAISGDLPLVLLQVAESAHIDLVRQLVQAHAYWRLKGLVVDLVIWNEDRAGYRQQLQDLIMGLIAAGMEASLLDKPGGIFVRPALQITNEDRILIQAVARVIISDEKGTLAEQISRRPLETPLPRLLEKRPRRQDDNIGEETPEQMSLREGMILRNGLGGFSADGSEYVIRLAPGQTTPAPWVNLLANSHFGTVVSESGSAYTWSENAHEFRLSPWHNDPVSDGGGEAFYIRDEETGHFWSPTVLPSRGQGRYTARHGFGYSVFEHSEEGIQSELWVYVALDAPVKFSVLKVRNVCGRRRHLSVTGFVEWILGDLKQKSAMHVVTESDGANSALLARNAYNMEFPERVAFFDAEGGHRTVTGDRGEFLGRNRTTRNPAAMARSRLSGRLGAGMDACAAIQVSLELGDGEEREVVFRLGAGRNRPDARALIQRYRGSGPAAAALQEVREFWRQTLSSVQVHTPDPALDVLANGWLMYQTIACRFWGRSGFYQSGGAVGFRDQLQDAMAMLHAVPQRVREHLLLSAAHQFQEGDVQHWWHPPLDRGVRTRCSDDFLWLPMAVSRYVAVTGDIGVLDEMVNYIEGRPLSVEEESYYDLPMHSEQRENLYQHCLRAIGRAAPRGERGLPLIGSGDWNDGMNRVGEHGRGESVWLGFFLYDVLQRFAVLARSRQDEDVVERCLADAESLRASIENHAWDGAWYRRAWFDDGTPLGTATNDECQIDSIAQSWSVLSGAGDPARSRQAMQSLDQRLVRRDSRIVQLLDPPFDKSAMDPGYIKGYVPGVRENGGQYTHAAVWATMAFAEMGDTRRAWELFDLINPVNHGRSAEEIAIYKVEPYVAAADVYGVAPHSGRGGWTWYTGSSGWMYRLIVESLLGLRIHDGRLRIRPAVRPDWQAYRLDYRYRSALYVINVSFSDDPAATAGVTVDGEAYGEEIRLLDDGRSHEVMVLVPTRQPDTTSSDRARVDE